ncbi:hypothetical protein BDV37DRAFT_280823 [Aspergillus pseudonomiae]|uniref:Enoyl reductase (ER) domain-containing protein n=1 Tax=Aspergillus pseudonomiae TaxID=1506151 RepID=A0A5N7DJD8_9EURO|nr:uncharacterized protein BDV37DRAFT_280823 [Aspergillus pseudonomiae]KAE8406547.1 hypothetical protein BDV37DRAFT_280823 [Aspergillus pseudonomiae]
MPLTYGTAYESLLDRLEIKKGEKVGILIINGAGGVGAMASQIARWVLELPVMITTASRPETIDFTKKMGATHVINHREDLKKQIDELHLDVPIKYVYITYSTSQYLGVCSDIIAPLGKVCSIVQSPDMNMYGTQFMSKSLTFVWCWLGSRMYHGVDTNQWKKLEELSALIDAGKIKCHLTRRLQLDLEGIKEAHRILESGKAIGKTILISYDTVEIYQQYGSIIEQMTKDKFAEKGATEQTLFISMRSMPPIHTTSFVAPENVTVDDLKEVQFPEGVHVDIHQEA